MKYLLLLSLISCGDKYNCQIKNIYFTDNGASREYESGCSCASKDTGMVACMVDKSNEGIK